MPYYSTHTGAQVDSAVDKINGLIDGSLTEAEKKAIGANIDLADNAQLTAQLNRLAKTYAFGGVAVPSTNPGTPDVNTFYLATEAGTYTNMGGVEVPNSKSVHAIVWDGEKWAAFDVGAATTSSLKKLKLLNGLYSLYDNDNIVLLGKGVTYDYNIFDFYEVNSDDVASVAFSLGGIESPEGAQAAALFLEFKDEAGTNLRRELLYGAVESTYAVPTGTKRLRINFAVSTFKTSVLDEVYTYSGLSISLNSIRDQKINTSYKVALSGWAAKTLATYGDSVTALQSGDFDIPIDEQSYRWGNRVANYLDMRKHYGRGVGGQTYAWGNDGGAIAWVYADTGILINRSDDYTLDTWDGSSFPSNMPTTQQQAVLSGLQDGTVKSIRGCACSWLRITSMFPASIKDDVSVVFVQFHNDTNKQGAVEWVAGDSTDPEWAASSYYALFGGDYNINTMYGGIASTIMKLQAWMPNALIVLGTPISGHGTTGEINTVVPSALYWQCEVVKEVAAMFSVPCIDVFATCGINGLNRTEFITDTIHPYTVAGSKMIARAVAAGLKNVIAHDQL